MTSEQNEDLAYGQNLIKQLGYRSVHDKKPRTEPTGTLYDAIFQSRVHKSKEMAKRTEGTKVHQMTQMLQQNRTSERDRFAKSYAFGGTLLEQVTGKREDSAWMRKLNQQEATAIELKRHMHYKRQGQEIEHDINRQVQDNFDLDTKKHVQEERQIQRDKRVREQHMEKLVKEQVPQQKATRLQEHLHQ